MRYPNPAIAEGQAIKNLTLISTGIPHSKKETPCGDEGGAKLDNAPASGLHPPTQWKPAFYVKYHANGGEGAMPAQTIIYGQILILARNEFTREHHVFAGWNTAADGASGEDYNDCQAIFQRNYAGELDLYAKWRRTTHP